MLVRRFCPSTIPRTISTGFSSSSVVLNFFRSCSTNTNSTNHNNASNQKSQETNKNDLNPEEQIAQALRASFQSKTQSTTTSSSETPNNSSSTSSSDNGGSVVGGGETEAATPKRKIRMRERNTVEEKTATFRTGAGSFLAGFSSMSLISLGCAFLFVPLYRLYCSPQGRGADPKFIAKKVQASKKGDDNDPNPVRRKLLSVRFLSDVGNTLPIAFVPLQRKMDVLIGEPALAFYSSYNKSNKTLLGVSTYTISPVEAMAYLNKIQCFCFEEQRFKPHELVEMPVFFYIDKDFLNDPMVSWLDEVILNYTFFNMEKTRDLVGKFQSVKSAQY